MNKHYTPLLLDTILNFIVETCPLGTMKDFADYDAHFNTPEGVSYDALVSILEHFENKGCIKIIHNDGNEFDNYYLCISLTVAGLQFQKHGGFMAQEVHLKQTFEKLKLELESLKKSYPERAVTFTSIIGNVASAYQAITGVAGLL